VIVSVDKMMHSGMGPHVRVGQSINLLGQLLVIFQSLTY
jgi:hypothetical protein